MKLFKILLGTLILSACSDQKNVDSAKTYEINTSIQTDVEELISDQDADQSKADPHTYYNRTFIEFYEDDQLVKSRTDEDPEQLFYSSYTFKGDTVVIEGSFAPYKEIGFMAVIYKDQAQIIHVLNRPDDPAFTLLAQGPLQKRIEVPCSDTRLTLSELPDPAKKQTIYGIVEFESSEYYSKRAAFQGKEILPRIKQKAQMKIHFRSKYKP